VRGIIEKALPKNLKDIYFTDGDSAMSFIEASADQRVKRRRVQSAIESLLSMDVLTDIISRLDKVRGSYGRTIEKGDLSKNLSELNDTRENFEIFLSGEEDEISDLGQEKDDLTKQLISVKRKIEEALKLGDREKLLKNIKQHQAELQRLMRLQETGKHRLSKLLNQNSIASSLLKDKVQTGIELLQKLKNNKQLPKQSIPVLTELLELSVCFCGSDLDSSTADGEKKRQYIQEKIKNSEESDKLNAVATDLYYAIQGDPVKKLGSNDWLREYEVLMSDEANVASQIRETETSLENIQLDVANIKDDYLQNLKDQERLVTKKIHGLLGDISGREYECTSKKSQLERVKKEIESLTKKLDKNDNSAGKYGLTDDLSKIFSSVFDRIKTEELKKVSEKMNELFLGMIGSDPIANPNTMIQSAALTEKFDIKVFGINGHELDPDEDLNGASRRAITIAFILALTKVSKVDAVNIIDTPLGMMSGFVKRSVLKHLVKESKQVVLFLTHSEIAGVEDIIDDFGGMVYTLTNPGHYPMQLAHKPPIDDPVVVKCSCSHRENCELCERRNGEIA
jgi:DNA sulfur modification protein DndD